MILVNLTLKTKNSSYLNKKGSLKNTPLPVWKTYLYQLQLQAPKPKPIQCAKNVPNRPPHYGLEYHGMISRQESEQLLGNEDGNYLVRESNNPPSSCTLAIKFNNETKNYKVYYDGAFYVGEKRFDNINDLVHDGLISFYIEKHASNYIAMMAEESNYAESPYVASRTALLAARNKRGEPVSSATSASTHHQLNSNHSAPDLNPASHHRISPPSSSSQSIHSSFQRQHQQQIAQQQQQQQPQIVSSQHHSFSSQSHLYPNQHLHSYPNHHLHHIQQHIQMPGGQSNANTLTSTASSHLMSYQGVGGEATNGTNGNINNNNINATSTMNTSTATTTSGVSTMMSQMMMMDKENRHMNGNSSMSSGAASGDTSTAGNNLSARFANSLNNSNNLAKSNAIFDRFDIMNSEKPHRFKPQNFKGPHWCDFCLNFMWGLVSQGVKCQDCGFQAHKKCSERTPPDCEPQMRFIKRIFGVDLTTLVKATNTIRPILVEKCIEEIERRKGAIETEGLYRVSGFSDAVDELKMAFDRGEHINFDEFKYNDIHIICSLLKLYLRQLPIPLITFDVYNKLIETFNTAHLKSSSNSNIVDSIKSCVVELPPAHYLTLKYLMEHLVKVSQYSSKNQMNYENLAIVFGPTLMRSINPDPVMALKNAHKEQKLTELMIANYTSIFEK